MLVYCKWVNSEVDDDKLSKYCKPHISDGRCERCETSPALKMGTPVDKLIESLKD
jgi:hypothetical protein